MSKLCVIIVLIISVAVHSQEQSLADQYQKWRSQMDADSKPANLALVTCPTKDAFVFDDSLILIQNAFCIEKNATSKFTFSNGEYSEEGLFRGFGYLRIHLGEDEEKDSAKPRMCVKIEKLFGYKIWRLYANFIKGRPQGTARLHLDDGFSHLVMRFNRGIPHGKFSYYKNDILEFIGTFNSGRVSGSCWLLASSLRVNNSWFLNGFCNGFKSFKLGTPVIQGNLDPTDNKLKNVLVGNLIDNEVLENCTYVHLNKLIFSVDCVPQFQFEPSTTNFNEKVPFKANIKTGQTYPRHKSAICDEKATEWKNATTSVVDDWFESFGNCDVDPFWFLSSTSRPNPTQSNRNKIFKFIELMAIDGDVYEAVMNVEGHQEAIEFQYEGPFDDEGSFHGLATLHIFPKRSCFKGVCQLPTYTRVSGTFEHGILHGRVQFFDVDKHQNTYARAYNGVINGVVVVCGQIPIFDQEFVTGNRRQTRHLFNQHHRASFVAYYENGKPVGPVWIGLIGGGFLYSKEVTTKNHRILSSLNVIYTYPGSLVSLIGSFHENQMLHAHVGHINRYRCQNNILQVEYEIEDDKITFAYEAPSNTSYGNMNQQDPYERLQIRFNEQTDTWEASRSMKKGSIVALASGMMYNEEQLGIRKQNCDKNVSLTIDQKKRCRTYRHTYLGGLRTIDIPDEADKYVSTVGLRIYESFNANTEFVDFDHPSFGMIRAVKATRDIELGEEILVPFS